MKTETISERVWSQEEIDNDMFGDEEGCDHLDAEVNWEGRLICICGYSKWLSVAEWKSEMKMQREAEKAWNRYLKKCAREEKRRPKSNVEFNNDQIPF